jgi:hypothetical protein
VAYNDKLKVRTWSLDGTRTENITEQLQSETWSGSYQDCCRQLSFEPLNAALCELGGAVRLYFGADVLFSGRIFERTRDSLSHTIPLVAYDRGIYLKRNEAYLAVKKQTPEAITRQICTEYGVSVGNLAETGIRLTRNFLGVSLYQIIQTLYTLASEQTGKKYQIRFSGDKLNVIVKEKNADTIRLIPGSNLLSCSSRESLTDMINSVAVYNDACKRTAAYNSSEGYAALYGLMQSAIKASACDDPAKTAKQMLEDNGISTTITAQCIGSTKLITGNTAVVHEPQTGTDGLFWILSDSHSLSRGVYQTKVTLDFRNLMDKQEAGSVPTK